MAISLSNEAKSNVGLSLEEKKSDMTWDEATMTWDEADFTWAQPELVLTKESKSAVSLSLEAKI